MRTPTSLSPSPLVTVIVPVYNVAEFLPACLNSLIQQKLQSIEIIIVDNGSNDGSLKICQEYAQKSPAIKLSIEEKQGLSNARNKGLLEATGKYISFVDSDDTVAPEMLTMLAQSLEETNADWAECMHIAGCKEPKNFSIDNSKWSLLENNSYKAYVEQFVVNGSGTPYVWNKLYKHEIIKKINLKFSGYGSEDYRFNMQFLAESKSAAFCSAKLYYYRIRNLSISRSFNLDYVPSLLETMHFKISVMNELGVAQQKNRRLASDWLLNSLSLNIISLVESTVVPYHEKRDIFKKICHNSGINGYLSGSSRSSLDYFAIKHNLFCIFQLKSIIKRLIKRLLQKYSKNKPKLLAK